MEVMGSIQALISLHGPESVQGDGQQTDSRQTAMLACFWDSGIQDSDSPDSKSARTPNNLQTSKARNITFHSNESCQGAGLGCVFEQFRLPCPWLQVADICADGNSVILLSDKHCGKVCGMSKLKRCVKNIVVAFNAVMIGRKLMIRIMMVSK